MKPKIIANRFSGGTIEIDESDLKWRISVYGLLIQKSKILLCENKINHRLALPGGAVELGESINETLMREFLEETGMKIQIVQFLGYKERYFHFDPKNESFQSLQLFFVSKSISITKARNDDLEIPFWLDINKIFDNQHLILQPHLEVICDHLKLEPVSI